MQAPLDGVARRNGSAGPLQSVGRALRVLEVIANSPDGLTAKQIAAELDLALPTTYHLLHALIDAGHVVHLSDQHVYGLGYMARYLGQALTRQLAVPPGVAGAIRAVHQDADAAAYYAVYRDTEVVIAHVEDSERRPARSRSTSGSTRPPTPPPSARSCFRRWGRSGWPATSTPPGSPR
ncbi:helix-turn-helix domain-containing protein [Saccharopolyspora spinosporotrichia]